MRIAKGGRLYFLNTKLTVSVSVLYEGLESASHSVKAPKGECNQEAFV